MDTLTLTLPEPTRQFIDEQAAAGGFMTTAAYVQELIEAERRRNAQAELEQLLLDGLNSPASPMTNEDWQAIREEGLARLQVRASS